jgi:Ca2+-binding EF-hand superfamily protein
VIASLIVSALFGGSMSENDPPKKKRQSVEDVFKKLDKDSDGKVTKDEFQAHPGIKNKDAAAKAFKAADADADGLLSLAEFRDWAERMTERRREKKPDSPR